MYYEPAVLLETDYGMLSVQPLIIILLKASTAFLKKGMLDF